MELKHLPFKNVLVGQKFLFENLIGNKCIDTYCGPTDKKSNTDIVSAQHYNFIDDKSGDFYYFEPDEKVIVIQEDNNA